VFFKIRVVSLGGPSRYGVTFFVGPDKDHLEHAGTLNLEETEYETLMLALHRGFSDLRDAALTVEAP